MKAAMLVQEQASKERNNFLKALQQFDEANNAAWELEAENFVTEMQESASTIGKQLRPDQLVVMGLLLKSQHHTTLVQLATGFGKSLMLALLAKYLNKITGKKVIVVIPSAFLHAY
jgi:superfamily II DNA or RNA helicase